MKELKIVVVSVLFVLLNAKVQSENPCGIMYPSHDTISWGIGFIKMGMSKAFAIEGTLVITNKQCYIGNEEIRIVDEEPIRIHSNDYVYSGGYNYYLLKVFEIKNNKYRICANTIKEGIWLEFDDFTEVGLTFTTYISYINKNKNYISLTTYWDPPTIRKIGVNLPNSCLNLRTKPDLESPILKCLTNNESTTGIITHLEILQIKNGWAFVLVNESVFIGDGSDGNECSFKLVNQYEGYVKVLDDNGRPNIWYAVSAY